MPSPSNRYPLERLFGSVLSPFERFLRRTTAGGIVLIATTILTLILANTPWGEAIRHIWETYLTLELGPWRLSLSLHHWINDGLMALFFLVVGLELKREILIGELSSLRNAALPLAGAVGGMLVPALLYWAVNPTGPTASGWGIPMATDIAFAVGILVLLAWRIPRNLIIFLTALAIADDLGAVLVIALFYTAQLDWNALGWGAIFLAVLILFNRGGIRRALPYALVGGCLWLSLLQSGIHATVAGVLLAFTIPARPAFTPQQFSDRLDALHETLRDSSPDDDEEAGTGHRMALVADNLEKSAVAVQSPQQRMEHVLGPWVTFVVIPLFAFANASIDFSTARISELIVHPVTIGVFFGLVGGKFLGIGCMSWLAVTLGLARLPDGVGWRHVFGVAWLGGIGFTMSLFISQLAFGASPELMEDAKFGILAASAVSGVVGLVWLYFSASRDGSSSGKP